MPKQFLPLGGDKSLLRETFERLEPLVTASRVWVVTNRSYVDRVVTELPEVPREHVVGEPVGRNTAPCIGLAAGCIAAHDADARILVCPADHVIRPAEEFRDTVAAALSLFPRLDRAGEPLTVTLGIEPRYPATGFGYIERGEVLAPGALPGGTAPQRAFRVAGFREKPPTEVARKYLASGNHYWNSGIFLWTARGISDLIARHLPDLAAGLSRLQAQAARGGMDAALAQCFGSLPAVSVDHGVLEGAANIVVIAATFEWDDLGSWTAIERYSARDAAGNSVRGRHVGIDTRRSIVFSQGRLIATVGLEDVVVVETADAVLVCRRDRTEAVKELTDLLEKEGLHDVL
jgi:mannose-1-phosphate guanylyltransferase